MVYIRICYNLHVYTCNYHTICQKENIATKLNSENTTVGFNWGIQCIAIVGKMRSSECCLIKRFFWFK